MTNIKGQLVNPEFSAMLGCQHPGGYMTETHLIPKITDDFIKMHEDFLVPIIFAQWAHHLTDLAEIESGHHVLDVACGTGVVARTALMEVGMRGKVTGLDNNEKMLAIARKKPSSIDWKLGNATALPFEDNSFDRVLCQFSLMFIENRIAAIKELLRVCKPNGKVVVSVWDTLNNSRVYTALANLTRQFAGPRAAMKLVAPWSLGIPGKMDNLLLSAGVMEYECHERVGIARFPSVETFVEVHLRSAGEYHNLDAGNLEQMKRAAEQVLAPHIILNNQLAADLNVNIFILSPD